VVCGIVAGAGVSWVADKVVNSAYIEDHFVQPFASTLDSVGDTVSAGFGKVSGFFHW